MLNILDDVDIGVILSREELEAITASCQSFSDLQRKLNLLRVAVWRNDLKTILQHIITSGPISQEDCLSTNVAGIASKLLKDHDYRLVWYMIACEDLIESRAHMIPIKEQPHELPWSGLNRDARIALCKIMVRTVESAHP